MRLPLTMGDRRFMASFFFVSPVAMELVKVYIKIITWYRSSGQVTLYFVR